MSRLSKVATWATDPANGWDARLWRLWWFYNALAYTLILAIVFGLTSADLDVIRMTVDHRAVGTLLIATIGAALYGFLVGALQWRVLRERVTIPRRRWVRASVIPAVALWTMIVVPAAIAAETSGEDLRVASLLALSQALALGPAIGFAQAKALQPYTRRWKWWIVANLVSWLIVGAVSYLLSLVVDAFAFAQGEASPFEAYLLLIAAAPLAARLLLWITAPAAAVPPTRPEARDVRR